MIKYYYYGDPHAHIPSLATAYPGKQVTEKDGICKK